MTKMLTAAAAIGAVLLTGCSDSTEPGNDSAVGSYALTRINGFALPLQIDEREDAEMVCVDTATAGSLSVRADGTFEAAIQVQVGCTDKQTLEETTSNESLETSGTYTRSGNTLSFDEDGGDAFTGVLSGSTLTLTVEDGGTTLMLEFTRL